MLVLRGKLPSAQLASLYQRARLFVSPLLNATGIATTERQVGVEILLL